MVWVRSTCSSSLVQHHPSPTSLWTDPVCVRGGPCTNLVISGRLVHNMLGAVMHGALAQVAALPHMCTPFMHAARTPVCAYLAANSVTGHECGCSILP